MNHKDLIRDQLKPERTVVQALKMTCIVAHVLMRVKLTVL